MEEVTGRDNQIICQALQIAIPIMLKHSMSASNTFDSYRLDLTYNITFPPKHNFETII